MPYNGPAMTPRAALIAAVGIFVSIPAVGILVSIAGEALLHGRSGEFAAMFQRAAIGSAGWGAIIAASASIIRRLFLNSPRAGG
jgi:hypothetical protein